MAAAGRRSVGLQRRLSTAPAPHKMREPGWDLRNFGAVGLESALVAAGVLASARTSRSRSWEVAPGVVLVQAGATRSGRRAPTAGSCSSGSRTPRRGRSRCSSRTRRR